MMNIQIDSTESSDIQIDSTESSDIQKQMSKLSAEIKKYRARFDLWRKAIFLLPIIVALIQLCALHSSLDFSMDSPYNWMSVPAVFAIPIGTFSFALAMVGVYGLYLRSLQTDLQLLRAHQQVFISQKQFGLASKKENMVMFFEHKRQILNDINDAINSHNFQKQALNKNYSIEMNLDSNIYSRLFPKNSPSNDLVQTPSHIVFLNTVCSVGDYLNNLSCKLDKHGLSDALLKNEEEKRQLRSYYNKMLHLGFDFINQGGGDDYFIESLFVVYKLNIMLDCLSRVYLSENENAKLRKYEKTAKRLLKFWENS